MRAFVAAHNLKFNALLFPSNLYEIAVANAIDELYTLKFFPVDKCCSYIICKTQYIHMDL